MTAVVRNVSSIPSVKLRTAPGVWWHPKRKGVQCHFIVEFLDFGFEGRNLVCEGLAFRFQQLHFCLEDVDSDPV